MKFESEFGLGEVVDYTRFNGKKELVGSELFEVIGILFQINGEQSIVCRYHDGRIMQFAPSELKGDPLFDQEKGCYPPEPEEDEHE